MKAIISSLLLPLLIVSAAVDAEEPAATSLVPDENLRALVLELKKKRQKPGDDITKEDCQRIQATWSPGERKKRSHEESVVHWTPPEVTLRAIEHLTLEQTWGEHSSGIV